MPSTRSATSERPEENRQQLEEKAGTLQMGACLGNGHSILPVAVPPTYWRPPVLFSSGTEPNRWITSLEIFLKASGLPRCQWAVAALNHMDSATQERLTARLGDDVNDYEVLKADLKKMFIPLKSEMSLRAEFCRLRQRPGEPVDAFAIRVQEAGERIRMTELQIVDRFREGTNSRAVLMALLEKADDYGRSTENCAESCGNRGTLNRLITRLDDRLPPRGDNGPPILTPAPTGDRYLRLKPDWRSWEHEYMRNRGNRTSREHPQPSRRLEGSSRKSDHPLASATDVLPPFWLHSPRLWFAQAEPQFALRHVSASLTKYYYVIASLPDSVAPDVDDLAVPILKQTSKRRRSRDTDALLLALNAGVRAARDGIHNQYATSIGNSGHAPANAVFLAGTRETDGPGPHAVGSSGKRVRCLFFVQERSYGMRFLVDTGFEVSVVPYNTTLRSKLPTAHSCQRTRIDVVGSRELAVDLDFTRPMKWKFIVARIAQPAADMDRVNEISPAENEEEEN
ncbi:hypothetical protein T06_8584 [Trichinella sp. T6]|nr:hypothetical protein T06_8584 [Trichinella sp. T6]